VVSKAQPGSAKPQHEIWRRNPALFITQALVNPQTGGRFELFEAERVFLKCAFRPTADGDLPYRDILWSCIKKSGKSTFGALCLLYVVVCLGGNYAEAYIISNDLAQAQDRVFTSAARIVKASPLIKAAITSTRITFSNGSYIEALPADYRGAAGVEPCMIVVDEAWGYTTEASRRLYEEVTTTPTRKPSVRMITSYAGFVGESVLLEDLVARGMSGQQIARDLYTQPGMIAFISHGLIAPWQTQAWLDEARRSTRASAFRRQYENNFAASESQFVSPEEWDAIVEPELKPVLVDTGLPIWVGMDLGLRHDSTAIIAVAWNGNRIRLVEHKIFVPVGGTLDIEGTAAAAILSLRSRFRVMAVYFDPWQAINLAQTLGRQGVLMQEWPQTVGNLSMMANNLMDLVKYRQLVSYPAPDLREAIAKTVIIESTRGLRLGKAKQSDRVDPVIALAMACIGCMQAGSVVLSDADREFWQRAQTTLQAMAERERANLMPSLAPPAESRLDGRGEDWSAYEDAVQSSRGSGGRFGGRRGTW
jgi:hypothetical protein